ncbi:MAG: YqgE/AlgH family protein [Flavobacteriaceae bacterium]
MPAGNFLYADPKLFDDSDFSRSVIFLTQHDSTGATGFILNHPSGYTLNDLLPELDLSADIFYGGPVTKDEIFYLHKRIYDIEGSIAVNSFWSWGNRMEGLKYFQDKQIPSTDYRIFLGYSGWENGQLEKEVKMEAWIPVEHHSTQTILEVLPEKIWPRQMRKLGGRYLLWSNLPDNPQYN